MKGRAFAIFLLIVLLLYAGISPLLETRAAGLKIAYDRMLESKNLEIVRLQAEVEDLKEELARRAQIPEVSPGKQNPREAPETPATPVREHSLEQPSHEMPQAARRVKLVKKFLSLSPEQEERLAKYFEAHDGNGQPEILAAAIEAELGKEPAEFYREQVRQAFERAEREEEEKEIFFLSRRLGLSPEQEASLSEIYREAGSLEEEGGSARPAAGAGIHEMQRFLQTMKRRRDFIDQRIKALLNAAQFQAYSEIQARSNEQELQLWHEAEK